MPAVTRYMTQNSVYEVCQDQGLARRITGKVEATPYTESGGRWKHFIACGVSQGSLVIVWHFTEPTYGTTVTSPIKDERHFVDEQKCPECRADKHGNCDGMAWDEVTDEPMFCQCTFATHVFNGESS